MMTPNAVTTTNGNMPATDKSKAVRRRKQARRKSASASRSAKKSSTTRRGNGNRGAGGYSATASRLMSRGKQAVGEAYGWAADSAGKAMPRAARYMPNQRTMQEVLEERPLILGAVGLGIGAMIGMMLPSRMMRGFGSSSNRKRRSSRRR